jgi:hypothetical protein
MTDDYKNLTELYKDLPNIIRELCAQKGLDPEKDLGFDLHDLDDPANAKTIYERNPKELSEKKWFKINCQIVCSKCKNEIVGNIILDRESLQVVDSHGFVITDEPTCDKCLGDVEK